MQAPSIGRIVHVLVDPASNNGQEVAAAIVTATYGPTSDGDGIVRHTISVRVVTDTLSDLPSLTSIYLYDERPSAEKLARLYPANPTGRNGIAFWPARV